MEKASLTEDVVRALGYLCLGSRLRRLGEQVQADAQRIMDGFDVPLQAGQYPLLAAISRLGPLSIGELAEAVGVSQPGVTRAAKLLVEAGYLRARTGKDDQRVRRLSLTEAGEALIARSAAEVWPVIEAAVRDACDGLSGRLIDQLDGLEDAMREKPLHRRALDHGGKRP